MYLLSVIHSSLGFSRNSNLDNGIHHSTVFGRPYYCEYWYETITGEISLHGKDNRTHDRTRMPFRSRFHGIFAKFRAKLYRNIDRPSQGLNSEFASNVAKGTLIELTDPPISAFSGLKSTLSRTAVLGPP